MKKQQFAQLPLFTGEDSQHSVSQSNDWLSEYLMAAELEEFTGRAESWEIEGSNAKLSYLSHGFFRYFGKFPPPVAKRFIEELHNPKVGPVVDPMVGSGTTLVESKILRRPSIGLDVNPLSVLIAKVKTTAVRRSSVLAVLDAYIKHMNLKPVKDLSSYIPRDRHLDHWFYPETQESIAWTRWFIENSIEDLFIKNIFLVALAANIRRFSRASNSLGRMFLDPAIPPQDVKLYMTKRVTKMAQVVEHLFHYEVSSEVRQHNAQNPLETPITNLVICHPPYFNLYKYSSIYKYEMIWLGLEYLAVRPEEVREGFKLGKEELVKQYIKDLGKVVTNIEKALTHGGWCVLMMGDTIIHGKRVNTTSLLARYIHATIPNLKVSKLIIRQPKFTEASYAATQRRDKDQVGAKLQDHLVVMQKVG
jgi:hypothetical protein